MKQVQFFLKVVTIQLGTKDDQAIVHVLKVNTWFCNVVKKSTFMKPYIGHYPTFSYSNECRRKNLLSMSKERCRFFVL